MRVEELDKEGKIIGFQDDFNIDDSINDNYIYNTALFNSRLTSNVYKLNKKYLLITCVIIIINKNKKFYELLKRLRK